MDATVSPSPAESHAGAMRRRNPPPSRRDAQRQRRKPGLEQAMRDRLLAIRPGYRGAGKLAGRTALITGGDSGIGRAVALHFAREGCDVAIMYLDEHADARETARGVAAEGRRCVLIPGDARSEAHCRAAVARAARALGRIDILVNNLAGQWPRQELGEISRRQLTRTFETNVFSFFAVTRYALAHMRKGGCIINCGSVTSFRGSKVLMDYAATKGAIESFTYSLAQNLAGRGIRVNGVAPGPIWTPLIVSTFRGKKLREFGQDVLLKRPGQPAEVGPAFVFLASDDASYVTGQFIHINGGGFIG